MSAVATLTALRPPVAGFPASVIPGIGLALLSGSALPLVDRFVRGDRRAQDRILDGVLFTGLFLGLFMTVRPRVNLDPLRSFFSSMSLGELGRFDFPNPLFPIGSKLWPISPTGGTRTNQEIFDAVISRCLQKRPTSMNPFYMADELLQEEGIRMRHELVGFRNVRIIDMRGVKVKGLNLKSVMFSTGHDLPGQKDNIFIDFSGSVFEDFKLSDGYFRNCLFDDVRMLNVHIWTTPFDLCQFSGGTRIRGTIEAGEYGGHFGRCLFDNVQWEGMTLRNIRFDQCAIQGNVFDRCILNGVTFKGEARDKYHHIKNSRFDRCRFKTTTFERASVFKSNFQGSHFIQSQFKFFRAIGVDFSSLPPTEKEWQAVFTECYIGLDSRFSRCNFRSVLMTGTQISSGLPQDSDGRALGILFEECDFSGFQFVNDPRSLKNNLEAQIFGTEFRRCCFNQAIFDPTAGFGIPGTPLIFDTCDFTRTHFSERRAQGFFGATLLRDRVVWRGWNNFEEVHWERVKLANLPRGNFGIEIEGNFTRAYLSGSDLYAANFGHSLMDRIDLRGASCQKVAFHRCRSLFSAQVDPRTNLWHAFLPRFMTNCPIRQEGLQQGALFV